MCLPAELDNQMASVDADRNPKTKLSESDAWCTGQDQWFAELKRRGKEQEEQGGLGTHKFSVPLVFTGNGQVSSQKAAA